MCVKEEVRSKTCIVRKEEYRPDEHPPWAGMAFESHLGSDDLFFHLKAAYPEGHNLLQRKHLAAIDFLTQELEAMQSGVSRSSVSHDQLDSISMSSPHNEIIGFRNTSADGSRPDSVAPRTPQSATSSIASQERNQYMGDHTQMSGAPLPPAHVASSQTYVFSAVDGTPMQPRTKKKMSMQERKDYKETRRRGACDKCRKTKAKCTHSNQSATSSQERDDLPRAPKRGGSTALDDDQVESAKLLKIKEGSGVRPRSPEKSRRSVPQHSFSAQLKTSSPSVGPLPMTGPVTDGGQCRIEPNQNEGYVHLSRDQQSQRASFSGNQTRMEYLPPRDNMDCFDPRFSGNNTQIQSNPYSSSPLMTDPHDPSSFQFGYSTLFDFPSMNSQDPQLGDTGQT